MMENNSENCLKLRDILERHMLGCLVRNLVRTIHTKFNINEILTL